MDVYGDNIKQNYESRSTAELVDLYINGDMPDFARSALSECLAARGEKLHILDGQKAKQSTYIKEEVKKGKHSMFNFRRWSTQLAFLVGLPLYLYLNIHGWGVASALMVSVFPLWIIFIIIEHIVTKRKIASLSDDELTSIADAKVGEPGYELQKISQDELKRRSSLQ